MKRPQLRNTLLALCASLPPLVLNAQYQSGSPYVDISSTLDINIFQIFGAGEAPWGPYYSITTQSDLAGNWSSGPVQHYFSLPGNPGSNTFQIFVEWRSSYWLDCNAQASFSFNAIGDYESTLSSVIGVQYTSSDGCTDGDGPPGIGGGAVVTIEYHGGNAWNQGGVREFSFGIMEGNLLLGRVLFQAVMQGSSWSETLGHFTAPQVPAYILRDPPGDLSYSQLQTGQNYCYGETFGVSNADGTSGFAKITVGTSQSVGLFVETDVSVGVTAGISASREETSALNKEYKTCLTTTATYKTSESQTRDEDLFIGSAVRYAYGVEKVVGRDLDGGVTRTAHLGITPTGSSSSFAYTESDIINTAIPQAQATADALAGDPTSIPYRQAVNQVAAWQRALEMNTALKADAIANTAPSYALFSGGGSTSTFDEAITTSSATTMDTKVVLEQGLSLDFALDVGGSGIAVGGEMTMRHEVGRGQSSSNETTTTHTISFGDDDTGDHFEVPVYKDRAYGAPVFGELDFASRTSCPFEGGYRIDQPQIWVGSIGQSDMTVNEVPIGGTAIFPIYACNNSDQERTYGLRLDGQTNPFGAIISGYNGITSGSTVQLTIPANECLAVGNLYLAQPDNSVVDFTSIEIELTSDCEQTIHSAINLSAHFGVGNVGGYCTPFSDAGPAYGDYIDGVQLAAINNTGSGGSFGNSYVDYLSQYSTGLSLNAAATLTITTGTYPVDNFAAWIDFDHSGTFDPLEKLGEFTSSNGSEVQNIVFTVPGNATLGTTRMRVRGCDSSGEPLEPCYNYYYGETEDYGIVIDDNPPLDCSGTPNGTALPGTACDDGNGDTGNDQYNANCVCVGVALDCAGVPGGNTYPGSYCDDGDSTTSGDVYDVDCICAGLPWDCTGLPGGSALPGTPCDDGNASTGTDVYGMDCTCAGLLIDCVGVPGGGSTAGTACDDGNPLTSDDAYNVNCACAGTLPIDCTGEPGGAAQPGTACDDNDPDTGIDTYGTNCICAGLPLDCYNVPGGNAFAGTPCDDWNPQSTNDVFSVNCICSGTLAGDDCAGVPGGTAQPGAACDDGDPATGNDVYNPFCVCTGQLIDCLGVAGGLALPNTFCDDGDPATGSDQYGTNCVCVGLLLDCEGVPGGTNLPGSACDDGNANSTDDLWNANCACAGTLANDCAGVPGGTAQPGTICDDNNAATGNDVYGTDCTCIGETIDCAGTAGGLALPGTACNDNDACTAGDVWNNACVCGGTTIQIGTITGDNTIDVTTTNTYYVTPVPGAIAYSWTLPSGWSSSNTSDFVLVATAGDNAGTVQVCVDAIVGACVVGTCLDVQVFSGNGIATGATVSEDPLTARPNPSNGIFQLIPASGDAPMTITVFDGTGRTVKAPFPMVGTRTVTLDLGDVSPGAYYLMATREGEQRAMKLIVQR